MAQGIANHMLKGLVEAESAGVEPSKVHPLAIKALSEIGVDISSARSKHVSELGEKSFDLVVTVCDGAKARCPSWPGQGKRTHFGLPDPARATGDPDEKMAAFRAVRDRIIQGLIPHIKRELDI